MQFYVGILLFTFVGFFLCIVYALRTSIAAKSSDLRRLSWRLSTRRPSTSVVPRLYPRPLSILHFSGVLSPEGPESAFVWDPQGISVLSPEGPESAFVWEFEAIFALRRRRADNELA